MSQRLLVIKIFDATNEFIKKNARQPSVEELSEITEIDAAQIHFLAQFSNKVLSIDDYVGDEDGNQLCDIIPDNEPLLDDQINKKFIFNDLEKMLDVLPDREHDLIRMLYGIGMEAIPPVTIANMFGVGNERIRQMKESALSRLRKKFSKQLKGLI
jgi:RNA polymerase primary sigma factor